MQDTEPAQFRLRSSDPWECAALYAEGFPIVGAEVEGERVFLLFPDGGENLEKAVHAHRGARLKVATLVMRQAYLHVRQLIDHELRNDRRG